MNEHAQVISASYKHSVTHIITNIKHFLGKGDTKGCRSGITFDGSVRQCSLKPSCSPIRSDLHVESINKAETRRPWILAYEQELVMLFDRHQDDCGLLFRRWEVISLQKKLSVKDSDGDIPKLLTWSSDATAISLRLRRKGPHGLMIAMKHQSIVERFLLRCRS